MIPLFGQKRLLRVMQRWQYKLKRYLTKECYKQCRYVKFKGTMTKWSVQNLTQRMTQKHVQQTRNKQLEKTIFLCFSYQNILFYYFMSAMGALFSISRQSFAWLYFYFYCQQLSLLEAFLFACFSRNGTRHIFQTTHGLKTTIYIYKEKRPVPGNINVKNRNEKLATSKQVAYVLLQINCLNHS